MDSDIILDIKNLVTSFDVEEGRIRAVDDVSFQVKKGKTLGLVGESGCGKSVTSLSVMRLLPKPSGIIEKGSIFFRDTDITKLTPDEMHKIRGNHISMIFQEPMTVLNPVHKIGKQLGEVYQLHFSDLNSGETINESLKMLQKIGIPDPEKRLNEYPHQLSGGMRQRIMIAMALACKPDILIADEPTTALDVTIQAQILDLILQLQKDTGMSVIFITHNLGVIAEICDEVVVMYAGHIIEKAKVLDLFKNAAHLYTKGLLQSIPRLYDQRKVKLKTIEGVVPGLNELPVGCRFQNRCTKVMDICKNKIPPDVRINNHHYAKCFLYK